MLRGEAYDSRDSELLALYHRARQLMQQYNQLPSHESAQRNQLLRQLLGHAAEGVWVEAPFYCDYGLHISVGAHTFINVNCVFIDNNLITIGQNCLIGPAVQIYTATHPLRAEQRIQPRADGSTHYLTQTKPVTIGHNVWVGGGAIILPGVTIGNNVTIGAGAVVTQSVPDNALAVGNPCKPVKQLN